MLATAAYLFATHASTEVDASLFSCIFTDTAVAVDACTEEQSPCTPLPKSGTAVEIAGGAKGQSELIKGVGGSVERISCSKKLWVTVQDTEFEHSMREPLIASHARGTHKT